MQHEPATPPPSVAFATVARRRSSSDPMRLVDAAWESLTSVRLAIVLLLAITAASLVGAAVSQAPPPALASPEQFALWLEQARTRFGVWTDALAYAGAFNVFGSTWFRLLMLLLAANVLVCTLNRTDRVWRAARRAPPAQMSDAMFDRAPLRGDASTDEPLEEATARIERLLGRHRYSWLAEREPGAVQLVGTKNRYGPVGTLFSHAGIIVVLLGVVGGGVGGFVESQFVIPEGSTRLVGHDTGLEVELVSFMDEYYVGGGGIPKDYRSDVIVRKQGSEVARGTVRVNEPLIVGGVRIHQAYYGPAIVMKVRDAKGNVLHEGPVPLLWSVADRPAGSFSIPSQRLEAFVIGSTSKFIDDVINPGEVRLEVFPVGGTKPIAMQNVAQGAPQTIGGLEFTFARESRFTGLQVVKDPALPLVWLGCTMVVLGSIAVLYFPRRRVWVRITSEADTTSVRLASAKDRGLPYEREFTELVRAAAATPDRDLDQDIDRDDAVAERRT